jgi:hypothetical protein
MPVDPRLGGVAAGTGDPVAQITQDFADLRRRVASLERSGSGVRPTVQVDNTAVLSVPNNSLTQITFNAAQINNDGMWVSGGNITANSPGIYSVTLKWGGQPSGTGGWLIECQQNGVIVTTDTRANISSINAGGTLSDILSLAAGDVLTFWAYQNSGITLNATQPAAVRGPLVIVRWLGTP